MSIDHRQLQMPTGQRLLNKRPLPAWAFVIALLAAVTMTAQDDWGGFLGDSLSEEAFLESLKPIEERQPPSVLPTLLKLAETEAKAESTPPPEATNAEEKKPVDPSTTDANGLQPQNDAEAGDQVIPDHFSVDGNVLIKRNDAGAVTGITYLDGVVPRTVDFLDDEGQPVSNAVPKPQSTLGPGSHSLTDILMRQVSEPPSRQENRQNADFHHQERSRQQNRSRNNANNLRNNNMQNYGGMPRNHWMGTSNAPPHSFDGQ